MIKLDDPIWETFLGGYKTAYNASVRLQELENGSDDFSEIWEEFWNELHHKGDVDIASYATVPHLVRICVKREILDWNAFALIAVIEKCRLSGENPTVPDWLKGDYQSSIRLFAEFAAKNFSKEWPKELTQAALSVMAFAKGCSNTGKMLIEVSDDEMSEALGKFFG